MPSLAMVIPTYNLQGYITKALQRVAAQTIPVEVWVVDDGSTDNTKDEIMRFTVSRPHFHLLADPDHLGISHARNAGLKHVNQDLVVFVDGDDLIDPRFAETLVHLATPGVVASAVGYNWWYARTPANTEPQLLDQEEMFQEVSNHGTLVGGYVWNKAFSVSAIRAANLHFDESLRLAEDYLFTASFVAATPGRYAYSPQILYTKVNRADSTIHTAGFAARQQEREVFRQIDRLGTSIAH